MKRGNDGFLEDLGGHRLVSCYLDNKKVAIRAERLEAMIEGLPKQGLGFKHPSWTGVGFVSSFPNHCSEPECATHTAVGESPGVSNGFYRFASPKGSSD